MLAKVSGLSSAVVVLFTEKRVSVFLFDFIAKPSYCLCLLQN